MLQKIILMVVIALFAVACKQAPNSAPAEATSQSSDSQSSEVSSAANAGAVNEKIVQAFKHRKSDVQVQGRGEVVKLLPDDNKGSRHQKFLVKISAEQTLLFAHNIDLAPRVADIAVGDTVEFNGEYVYNPKGGVIHWTHKAPRNDHEAGWIKHNGKTYE